MEGVRSITTNKIAHSAGVSTATLYRYFADFEGVFVTLGSRIWQEDLSVVAKRLTRLPLNADSEAWAAAVCAVADDGPLVWNERIAVSRAMDAVPSMRPVLNAGYEVGGRLLAEAVAAQCDCDVSNHLLSACRATFRMLRAGTVASAGHAERGISRRDPGFGYSAAVLIAGLVECG